MAKTRKRITMLVTVSVPIDMPAAQARLEVKTLIGEQTTYYAEPEDIKAIAVKPAKKAGT